MAYSCPLAVADYRHFSICCFSPPPAPPPPSEFVAGPQGSEEYKFCSETAEVQMLIVLLLLCA